MTRIAVKGFKIFRDRKLPFKLRCYHRATGIAIDLAKAPLGSAEFFDECARIAALRAKSDEAKPGTLASLVAQYRAGLAFSDLAPRTKRDYQRVFDYLQPIAGTPLVRFDRPLVVRIRDQAASNHGRRFGNYTKQVFSLLFGWGVESGYLANNPADKIKNLRRPKDAPQANRPWTDSEREAVLHALPKHMLVPIAFMMFCGLDPQDALLLPRSAIRDGLIDSKRGKTAEPIWLPLPAPVKDALVQAPRHSAMTVAANKRGQVWTGSGFRASWGKIRLSLEAQGEIGAGLTLKGLRHTVATMLAEMGYDDRTIADMLGQRTLAMAQHYSRRADRSRKMTAVITNFDAEVNRRRTETVKLRGESVKPEKGSR